MNNFIEVANVEDPRAVVKATQMALIAAMKDIVSGLKKDIKAPGMTWEQVGYLLDSFEKKEVTIFEQSEEM